VAWILVMAVGVYFLALPFALSLFSRTTDAEKLNDFYRPLMSEQGIKQFDTNLQLVDNGGAELTGVVLPRLARDLNMTDAQLSAYLAQNDPHVAAFLAGAPELLKLLNPATQAVLAQKDNFHDADEFPIANVRMDLGPWALLALAGGVLVLAFFIRNRPRPILAIAVLVLGVGLLAGPLVLGWFHETTAAEKVAQAARPPFSPAVANTVVDNIYKIDAAFTETRKSLFPAVAQQLDMTPAQMDAYVHTNFPATIALLDAWDSEMFKGAHDLSLSQVQFMDEFHNADATPYRALPWLVMLPGIVLIAAGALMLVRRSGLPEDVDGARDHERDGDE
jgi:hypothetical protein